MNCTSKRTYGHPINWYTRHVHATCSVYTRTVSFYKKRLPLHKKQDVLYLHSILLNFLLFSLSWKLWVNTCKQKRFSLVFSLNRIIYVQLLLSSIVLCVLISYSTSFCLYLSNDIKKKFVVKFGNKVRVNLKFSNIKICDRTGFMGVILN